MSGSTHSLKRIAVNTAAVLGGDVLNKAGTFLVYAILARQASVHEFGQLSLGLLLLYTFHVFAVAGLPVALTRQVARHPRATHRLLRHGYLAALFASSLATAAMILLAVAMQYERQTVLVIVLLALAVPPYALSMITEAVIKGSQRMHLITLGCVPGNVLLVVGSFVAIQRGHGVLAVAAIIVLARTVTWITMHRLAMQTIPRRDRRRPRVQLSWMLLRRSMVFLGTDGMQAIGAALSGVLLSKFASERELGLLGASYQLLQPIQMFYRSVGHSCFPQLVTAARGGAEAVAAMARPLLGFILRLAIPATIGVFVLAGDLLGVVYGNPDFRAGAIVFQIVSLTLLLDPLNPILGHGLWAVQRDRTVLSIVVVNVVTNALAGLLLIGYYGLIGAAVTSVVASTVNLAQHYWHFHRGVGRLQLGREVVRLLFPTAVAVATIALLPVHPYAALSIGLSLYMILAFVRIDPSSFLRLAAEESSK
ncbi:oligosaccharide flippase family protein [Roseimaritima sediminicola]|uniref:oligosaccharide flippase family protein n=1 Tax=Roseimaritima sediminicola TaxID=2662066 RepID=UPI001298470E|nr:oligosaccharide flippase family protein [Roseimaritima sediminicola]